MIKKIFLAIKKWWSDVLGTRHYLRYLEKEDRRRRLAGQFLTFLTIVLGIIYLVWHWQHINWDAWYYSFVFFLAELIGLLLFSFFAFNAWFPRFHTSEAVTVERPFIVDVFITVAGEPIELLKETVEAALRIDFQNKRICILDDKGDVEYQKLAQKNGCDYFAREDHSDAKAGNLNYAFLRTKGDLILALDADQIPQPQIVNALIGYFNILKIAFVQTKQDFKVPLGDPFGNTDRIFYNVMQSGKDNDNAAFSCGSGVIYRRKALEEIGGFSTWNLVEDVHTSMLLHERGWRSIYYNHSLTRGTAPADIYGVYRQRKQWAADSLRILFWDNPFFHKGLTFKQKLQYFHLGFVYLVAAFVMPLFFITPIWALLAQKFILTAPVNLYVLHRFPYFIAMSLAYGILNYPTHYMKAFQMWTGLFPVFIQATWVALFSRKKKPAYHVNVKPTGKVKIKNPWLAILPQLGIIILAFFSIIYAFITGGIAWDFYLLNLVWLIWSVWTMNGISSAATMKLKWHEGEELKVRKAPSFFSRTGELLLTVVLTISVALFFITVDPSKMDQFMNGLRLDVLQTLKSVEPPGRYDKKIPKTVEVPKPVITKALELPVKSGLETYPTEKKEEVVALEHWVVQVVSVNTQEEAKFYRKALLDASFPVYAVTANVKGQSWIRIRVGFFTSEEEARAIGEKIRKKRIIPEGAYWIAKVSPKEKERTRGNRD